MLATSSARKKMLVNDGTLLIDMKCTFLCVFLYLANPYMYLKIIDALHNANAAALKKDQVCITVAYVLI